MAMITLNGELREGRGKGPARQSRMRGLVPGVMYGKGEEAITININLKELITAMSGHSGSNVIIDFKVRGQESVDRKALLRDVQRDPISGGITHIDLHHIDMSKEIEVDIPVHITGTAIGVKDYGGILEFPTRSVAVRCLPTNIPDFIGVDVSKMMVHDAVHARDLVVENARIMIDPDAVIITVSSPALDKTPGAVDPTQATAAEPEVIGAKKPAEGEGADAGKGGDKKDAKKDKK